MVAGRLSLAQASAPRTIDIDESTAEITTLTARRDRCGRFASGKAPNKRTDAIKMTECFLLPFRFASRMEYRFSWQFALETRPTGLRILLR